MTMVDEKDDRYEGQEEEEYHFSDDQVNYEVDAEIPKTSAASDGLLSKFKQKREILLGVVALVVLIFFVYKMIMPAPTPPPFELGQGTVPVKKPATITHVEDKTVDKAADKNTVRPSMDALASLSQPAPAPSSAPTSVAPQTPAPTMAAPQPTMPTPPAAPVETAPPAPPAVDATQVKKILDRVGAVEQQNSAVMNVLQTEYAQKLADYETQNTAMRGKVTELTKRLNDIDSNLAQLTKLLTGVADKVSSAPTASTSETPTPTTTTSSAPAVVQQPPATKSEPKIAYTVQAIIPGRAWLKADTGDTVTVAEGDVLKDYGRITKIDPYDGIVEIDTGNKMITLSYGVGAG